MWTPPSGFYIGKLFVGFYGITFTIAIVVAFFVSQALAKHRNIDKKTISLFAIFCVPIGIIFARVLHVILNAGDYTFYQAIAFWKGWSGLSIYGGIIGGVLGIVLMCFWKKKNIFSILDVVVPGFILAQAIGRWGNFFNSELYGPPVKFNAFPFSVFIEETGKFHAAFFFYEFLTNIAGFVMLLFLLKKTKSKGIVTGAYLIFYGIVRAIMEPLRDKQFQPSGGGFNTYILISAFSIATGIAIIGYIVYTNIKRKKTGNADIQENV